MAIHLIRHEIMIMYSIFRELNMKISESRSSEQGNLMIKIEQ